MERAVGALTSHIDDMRQEGRRLPSPTSHDPHDASDGMRYSRLFCVPGQEHSRGPR